jgi:hypothetical protein
MGLMRPMRLMGRIQALARRSANDQPLSRNSLMMVFVIPLLIVPAIFHIHAHHHFAHPHLRLFVGSGFGFGLSLTGFRFLGEFVHDRGNSIELLVLGSRIHLGHQFVQIGTGAITITVFPSGVLILYVVRGLLIRGFRFPGIFRHCHQHRQRDGEQDQK